MFLMLFFFLTWIPHECGVHVILTLTLSLHFWRNHTYIILACKIILTLIHRNCGKSLLLYEIECKTLRSIYSIYKSVRYSKRLMNTGTAMRWNTLPSKVKCTINTNCFKKTIKAQLFNFENCYLTVCVLNIWCCNCKSLYYITFIVILGDYPNLLSYCNICLKVLFYVYVIAL